MLGTISYLKGKTSEKLSSGYRINRAADDAAGLSISEKMRKQIRGLSQAALNAQDGISLCQTAEGALNEVHEMLQRLNELSVKSTNGTNGNEDRRYLQNEVQQIQEEINKVAVSTKFNEHILLNGEGGEVTEHRKGSGTKLMPKLKMVEMRAIKADKEYSGTTGAGNTNLKNLLKNEIVPNAVQAILDTFPGTFSYLEGSDIGIGLEITTNFDSSVLAFVSAGTSMDKMFFKLSINTAYYSDTEEGRMELERTVGHEMMHALMTEALTAGMTNQDKDGNETEGFPSWFIEGTAQLVSGAFEPNNDWIYNLNLRDYHDEGDIELRLSLNKLGSGTSASEYGTGYLAMMYLGHLIGGKDQLDANAIADGVDQLLSTIRSGKSLDSAINELTQYNGINDFTNQFSKDGAAFTKQLMDEVNQNSGTGSIILGKFETPDILENGDHSDDINSELFALDINYTTVINDYSKNDPNHVMIEGGLLYTDGEPGEASGNQSTPDGPGDITDPDQPGGNGGTDVDNPGTGEVTDPNLPVDPSQPVDPNQPIDPDDIPTEDNTDSDKEDNKKEETLKIDEKKIFKSGMNFQLGIDSGGGSQMTILLPVINTSALGIHEIDISSKKGSLSAIGKVEKAIHIVSTQCSRIGSYQNRLEHTVKNLDNVVENTTAAESRIRDTDMAKTMVEYSKLKILEQASESLLVQSNHINEGILKLIQ